MKIDGKIIIFSIVIMIGASGLLLLSMYAELFHLPMSDLKIYEGIHIVYLLLFLWMFWGYGQGFKRDATDLTWLKKLPEYMNPVIEELEHFGFSFMALAETRSRISTQNYEWLYTNEDNLIIAMIWFFGESEPGVYHVRFGSIFPDDATVVTSYPTGMPVDRGKDRSIGISSSLLDAYHFHLRQMGEFTARYGEPIPIDSYETLVSFPAATIQKQIRAMFTLDFILGVVAIGALNMFLLSVFTLLISNPYLTATDNLMLVMVIIACIVIGYFLYRFDQGKDIHNLKKKEMY